MQTVKAIKALPGRQEGSVFKLDENSARVHKERGNVEFVDDDEAPEAGGMFVRTTTRRSGAAVTQVAAADYPETGDTDESGEAEGQVTETADVPGEGEVTKSSTHAKLVAAARGNLKHDDGSDLTDAEVESLTKGELVAKLGL